MAEAVFDPLPISIESIRLFFFIKSTRKNWGKQNSYPPVCSTTRVRWRPGKNINMIWFTLLFLISLIFFFIFRLFHTVKRMKIGNNTSNGDRHTDSSDGGLSSSRRQINGNLMACDCVDKKL
jgi:hypothetical protein